MIVSTINRCLCRHPAYALKRTAPLRTPQEDTIRPKPVYIECSGRVSDAVTGAT